MKNKLLRVLFLAVFGAAGFYLFKSWDVFREKTSFKVDEIQYSQAAIDVKEVKTAFKEPVWFVKTDNPMVCFNIIFKNEGNRSFHKTPGLLTIVLSTLIEGAGSRDSIAYKKLLNEKATSININSTSDDLVVSVSCLERYLDVAIELLCDVLSKAHLKKEKLEISKQGLVTSISQAQFDTDEKAAEKMNAVLYPEEHPYRSQHATVLKKIPTYTKKDADDCYAKMFDPSNAVVTIVGNLDESQIVEACKTIYESISHKKNDFKDVKQETKLRKSGVNVHVPLENPQSTVMFVMPGVSKASNERFAVTVANMILGAVGFNSRLLKSLRDKDGLVYRISSTVMNLDMQAAISGSAKTRPENTAKAIKKVKEVVATFFKDGVTQEELDTVKTMVFSNDVTGSTEATLGYVSSCREKGVPRDEVDKYYHHFFNLSLEEVNSAVKKYFDPSTLNFVSCGEFSKEKKK